MRANLKSYSTIILILILLFSCDNKRTKLPEVNTTKSKDTTSSVKRQTDSTKIAFSDIEFGMSIQDLLNTRTFKGRSSKDLVLGSFGDSYVMNNTLKVNNIPESLLNQENIIREKDIQTIEIIDKIGLFKYNIKAILVKNSMNLVQINPWSENEGLENIVKVISLKYGNPIIYKKKELVLTSEGQKRLTERHIQFNPEPTTFDCKEIPKAYCLYEWKIKNKNIKIFSFYFTKKFQESDLWPAVLSNYQLEIYSDKVLSDIVNNFKSALRDIENNRNKIKAKDSEKF